MKLLDKKTITSFFIIFIGLITIIPIFCSVLIPIWKSTLIIVGDNILIKSTTNRVTKYLLENNEKTYKFESIDKKIIECYITNWYINNNEYYLKLSLKNEVIIDEGMYWINFNYGSLNIIEYYYIFS